MGHPNVNSGVNIFVVDENGETIDDVNETVVVNTCHHDHENDSRMSPCIKMVGRTHRDFALITHRRLISLLKAVLPAKHTAIICSLPHMHTALVLPDLKFLELTDRMLRHISLSFVTSSSWHRVASVTTLVHVDVVEWDFIPRVIAHSIA